MLGQSNAKEAEKCLAACFCLVSSVGCIRLGIEGFAGQVLPLNAIDVAKIHRAC